MDGRLSALPSPLDWLQFILHYGGHFVVPVLIAWVIWREQILRAAAAIIAANAIDLDHLLATPIFDAHRCSIGFHLLHGWEAALAYTALLIIPRWWTRAFGLGALWHLAIDWGDCAGFWM